MFSCLGINTAWPCGAVTATDIVRYNDKEVIGVDGLAGANACIPPAGFILLVASMIASSVVIPA